MNSKHIAAFLLITTVFLAGCAQPQNNTGNVANTGNNGTITGNNGGTQGGTNLTVGNFTVEITQTGYSPQSLTIKKGSTVTWVNNTDTPNWPATAMHPTHTKYPGSSITKCGTAEEPAIFDACKNLLKDDSYSFVFNETGEWPYHDHVEAKTFGKIIVVE